MKLVPPSEEELKHRGLDPKGDPIKKAPRKVSKRKAKSVE